MGKQNGISEVFYENGKLKAKVTYKMGEKDGPADYFYKK
jgi:antitoxin component YwqK of YwqJK toxin-antitoxin module